MVKKTKKTASKKVASKKTTPAPVAPPAKEVKAPVDSTPSLGENFTELLAQLSSIRTQLTV